MIFRYLFILVLLPSFTFAKLNTIYLAGGCFWCVEEVYEEIKGVVSVQSGYSGGHVENPTYREVVDGNTGHIEAVEIVYDSDIVSLDTLVKSFFLNNRNLISNLKHKKISNEIEKAIGYQYKENTISILKKIKIENFVFEKF